MTRYLVIDNTDGEGGWSDIIFETESLREARRYLDWHLSHAWSAGHIEVAYEKSDGKLPKAVKTRATKNSPADDPKEWRK